MDNIITALREILGPAEFYVRFEGQNNYTWDYGAMFEYFVASMILMICVSSVFRFIMKLIK